MHPLSPNLSEMPLDELVKKQGDLITRLNSAYRMGRPDIVQQLQMLLGDYQNEIGVRNQRQLDEMQKNSKNFKNIIDIQ
jgi:hypothetical protein